MKVGNFELTTKTGIIILGIVILVCVVAGVVLSQGSTPKTQVAAGQVTVTINRAIGIDYITINNLDAATGKFVKTYIQLPYSFNCSVGDALEFTGATQTGYAWNGWQFSTGHFMTSNPLTIISNDDDYAIKTAIVITPNCYPVYVPPTASPTPTASPASGWGDSK